ncbi:MAG: dihydropteroate synthase [Acidimicrobiaceae bacterium]|nr:dihydropteroate synthase [Acidimicrobiaceae bacterium]
MSPIHPGRAGGGRAGAASVTLRPVPPVVPHVMGVLNVTPDSFSDGGRYLDLDVAVARGLELVAEGADVVDVGGESTRPGAEPVPEAEELRRVVPVVTELAGRVRVSIDTTKRAVAEAAIDAGATLINDVSASLWSVAAQARRPTGWVAMHMKGTPGTMQSLAVYDDVVGEVCRFLSGRVEAARGAGVDEVWVDPGLGFAKTAAHNLLLLRRLRDVVDLGAPVLVGASRKSFLGPLADGAAIDDRLEGSLACAVWAANCGASMVRVHDVKATVQAMHLVAA